MQALVQSRMMDELKALSKAQRFYQSITENCSQ